jgi:hypothetical protein
MSKQWGTVSAIFLRLWLFWANAKDHDFHCAIAVIETHDGWRHCLELLGKFCHSVQREVYLQ